MNWRRLGKDLLDVFVIGPFMIVMLPIWAIGLVMTNAYLRYRKGER